MPKFAGVGLESETHFYIKPKKKPTGGILVTSDVSVRIETPEFRVTKGIGYEK